MIQGFFFGMIFLLSVSDVIYKIMQFEQFDLNNALCAIFSLIGVIASIW